MKRKLYIFVFFYFCIQFNLFTNESEIENILQNESITIGLPFSGNSRNLAGVVNFNKGHVSSYGNGTFSVVLYPDYIIKDNYIEIYYTRSISKNFLDENKNYFIWSFPERLKVIVTMEDLIKAKTAWNHFTRATIDTSQIYPTTCQGIVIDNLIIRNEPSLSGKKIGKLKKRDEVTLYEQSKFFDEIDGEKNPWYKVKVSENEYGWVYGGYVRIFFEDENLGYYSKKERILESLE